MQQQLDRVEFNFCCSGIIRHGHGGGGYLDHVRVKAEAYVTCILQEGS
jgi:hypothetical protein